ncbi:MAG: cyclopropane-fatty-acyl-phospholipid synthase family protein [Sphingomonas bacterium]
MLQQLIRDLVAIGRVTLTVGHDSPVVAGNVPPGAPNLDVAIRIRDHRTAMAIAADPDLQLGEAYMDGRLTIERGTLWDFMEIIGRNIGRRPAAKLSTILRRAAGRFLDGSNTLAKAKANVEHHYDLSNDFYRLFLDRDLQYSCAYFTKENQSLEAAQAAKKAHIIAKLGLHDGCRVLDIGCGWGGLALSIARAADVEVTGITLSVEQLTLARQRAEELGLADRVHFELLDYRSLDKRFDRIVSVGMFEHVGRAHFDEYFRSIRRLLAPGGVALVHSIGRKDPGPGSNPWMTRHIFPGGYIPAASEALAAVERSGLWTTDMEILRLHYAETLRHWRERVELQREAIEQFYDARFYRMWTFYLAACEMSFRYDGLMVVQLQIAADIDAVPLTRDYLSGEETRITRRLAARVARPPAAMNRAKAESC